MKKILIGIVVLSVLSLVGCGNTESNNIELMSTDKAEVVVKSEYVSRVKRLAESTIGNDEIILDEEEKAEKEDEYDKKYLESKVLEEQFLGGDRDRYKDFTVGLSTFRTEDEEINKLHDKLIEVSLDVYNMLNENIELAIELDSLYDKEKMTETDANRMDEIEDRQEILEDMIDNQIEHTGNIGKEIFNILGVEF